MSTPQQGGSGTSSMNVDAPQSKAASGASSMNLMQVLHATVEADPQGIAARFKRDGAWQTLSWQAMEDRARELAYGLVSLGVEPGDRVCVMGNTSIDWVLSELAAHLAGATSVPIYQSNTPAEAQYVIEDSGASLAIVEDEAQLAKFREVKDRIPAIRKVVLMTGRGDGDWVLDFDSLVTLGQEVAQTRPAVLDERVAAINPDDPACFIYTSGTTGPPKGVVLTHSNWVYEGDAVAKIGLVSRQDEEMLFLPLAHSFAQVLKAAWFRLGHPMAFAESIDNLIANFSEVRPTMMASVPRIFEKVFTKVVSKGLESPGIKGKLFHWAMGEFGRYVDAKRQGQDYGGIGFALANKLVFTKVGKTLMETFGGRIRFFISGGAPLSPKIAYFFDLAGITILEGYGLTETSAATCVNRPGQNRIGTVGPPVPGTEIRIAEDGEILIRGGGVMHGYYNLPEATAEVLEPNGWFHSGDIGELDANGRVRITDRKKDIIVTAGGKNVAPQNIENQLKTHPLVSQVLVHGDKRKYLVALFTLDEENLTKWAQEHGVSYGDFADLTRKPEVKTVIQGVVDELNGQLASYESVKKIAILDYDFSQEDGTLTPTLKVKRRVIEKRHQALLDAFYDESYE